MRSFCFFLSLIVIGCGADLFSDDKVKGPPIIDNFKVESSVGPFQDGPAAGVDTTLNGVDQLPSGLMDPAGVTLKKVETEARLGCFGLECIPRIDYPPVGPALSRSLGSKELVLGVVMNGEARAYPLATLWQAEIINDTLGGIPICVNFCPLTGTGLNYKVPIVDSVPMTFGVSGLLYNNNLILYDHQTGSYWPQMLFTAAWGELVNSQMKLAPIMQLTWEAWVKLYPNSTVVDGRYDRSDPYGGYRTNHGDVLFPQVIDNRLQTKDLVYGVIGKSTARVYPFNSMGNQAVVNDILDGNPIVILYDRIAEVAMGYIRPSVNGVVVEFEQSDVTEAFPFKIKDKNSDLEWTFTGKIQGQDSGDLVPITTAYTGFWLSWGTYYTDIEIWTP